MKKHYVYIYLDPRKSGKYTFDSVCFNFEPIYIGKGSGYRSVHHLNRKDKHPLTIKLNKIKNCGLEPIIFIFDYFDDEKLAYQKERNLISEIGRLPEGCLTNLDSGGIGGKSLSYCTLQKLSKAQLGAGNGMFGRKHSEEIRLKIASTKLGKKHSWMSEDIKKKISKSNKGKRKTEEHKQKLSEAHTGKILTETHKENIGKATIRNANKIFTAERNNKIRISKCKEWVVVDPNGNIFFTNNLIEFCNEKNLGMTTLKKTLLTKKPAKRGGSVGWLLFHKEDFINHSATFSS